MKIGETVRFTSDGQVLVRDRRDFEKDLKDQTFEKIKMLAILIRRGYDNTNGYVDKKIERVESIMNLDDQFIQFFAMFDQSNRIKLANLIREYCSKDERREISNKLYIYFGPYFITCGERINLILRPQETEEEEQEAIEVDEDNDRLILILLLALLLALGTFILGLLYNG